MLWYLSTVFGISSNGPKPFLFASAGKKKGVRIGEGMHRGRFDGYQHKQ